MSVVQPIDLAKPEGGFWVDPKGGLIPVWGKCDHERTINSQRDIGSYGDAYRLGYVRVSTCQDSDHGFYVTFITEHATVKAICEAVSIARHHALHRPHSEWRFEDYDCVSASVYETDGNKFARKLMKIALEKNAAEKQAAAQQRADAYHDADTVKGLGI
jgi:hypothetical protein